MLRQAQLVAWRVIFTKQAQKDAKKLKTAGNKPKAESLIALLTKNPPPYEKLVGDLAEAYTRRISIQDRLVYEVLTAERIVKVLRMWTHYE